MTQSRSYKSIDSQRPSHDAAPSFVAAADSLARVVVVDVLDVAADDTKFDALNEFVEAATEDVVDDAVRVVDDEFAPVVARTVLVGLLLSAVGGADVVAAAGRRATSAPMRGRFTAPTVPPSVLAPSRRFGTASSSSEYASKLFTERVV